jgi:hypothetical protein
MIVAVGSVVKISCRAFYSLEPKLNVSGVLQQTKI